MERQSIPQKNRKSQVLRWDPSIRKTNQACWRWIGNEKRQGPGHIVPCCVDEFLACISEPNGPIYPTVPSTQSSLSVLTLKNNTVALPTYTKLAALWLLPHSWYLPRSLDSSPFRNSKSEALLMTEETSDRVKRNRNTHARDPGSPSTSKVGVVTPLPSKAWGGISQVWVSTLP